MENYVKVKVFYWVVGLLVVLNLAALGVMWFGKPPMPPPPPHREGGPPDGPPGHMRKGGLPPPEKLTEFFKERLGWNDDQAAKFEPLKEAYGKESSALFDSIRMVRKEMFNEIFTEGSKKDELINKISELQRRIDEERYRHFKDISDISTPEQKEKFKELLNEVLIPEPGPDGRGPRRGPPEGIPPPPR